MNKTQLVRYTKKFAAFALALPLLALLSTNISRAEEQSWTSADNSINIDVDKNDKTGLNKDNTDCYEQTLTTLKFESADAGAPTKTSLEKCVLNTPAGTFGGGFVNPNTFYSYKVRANNTNLVGIPNSDKFLYVYHVFGYNYSVRILENLPANGTFEIENSNYYRGYVYKPRPTDHTLRDTNNAELRINEFAFSSNGKWMVAETPRGFVRINIGTKQVNYFSDISLQHGYGAPVEPILAISNDGKYAITSGRNAGGTHVYDISKCENQSDFNIYNVDISGCESKNLATDIRAVNDRFSHINGVRFFNDGRTITGTMLSNTDSQGYETSKITLSLDAVGQNQPGYLALGDSFASGEGDRDDSWYEEGTNEEDVNMCHLSKRSYPYLLASDLGLSEFHSVACSGAKQEHILHDNQHPGSRENTPLGKYIPGAEPQHKYVENPPSFLTISIGGNDMGFSSVLYQCIYKQLGDCSYATHQGDRNYLARSIKAQYPNLVKTYQSLIQKTQSQTKIYVIGYPEFIQGSGGTCGLNVPLSENERYFVQQATQYANDVIEAAAGSAGVYYIDAENALSGQNLCSGASDESMAVNGITYGDDEPGVLFENTPVLSILPEINFIGNESFHPNELGHELLRDDIVQRIGSNPASFQTCEDSGKIICPDTDIEAPNPDPNYFGDINDDNVQTRQPLRVEFDIKRLGPLNFRFDFDGLKPGSPVEVEIQSDPVKLGDFQVDDNGVVDIEATLPSSIPAGFHEIHLYGQNIAGEKVDYFQQVFVTGPEGDINGNGLPDEQEACIFVSESGVDRDQDGIDDACDGFITQTQETNEDARRADIIGLVDTSNNSSNFLIQNGGGLQSIGGVPQGSSVGGFQNNGNALFPTNNSVGRQDLLGQSSSLSQPVTFDTGQLQNSDSEPTNSSFSWGDGLIFVLLAGVVIVVIIGGWRIFNRS